MKKMAGNGSKIRKLWMASFLEKYHRVYWIDRLFSAISLPKQILLVLV